VRVRVYVCTLQSRT